MFDIGFSELFVIAVVALIVIGPERLPKVARTMGHLVGRLQRYVNDVKADISREMELEELKKLRSQFEDAAKSVQSSVNEVDQQVRAVETEVQQSIAPPEPPAAAADVTAPPPAEAPPSSAVPPVAQPPEPRA